MGTVNVLYSQFVFLLAFGWVGCCWSAARMVHTISLSPSLSLSFCFSIFVNWSEIWVGLIYVRKWRRIRSPKGEPTNSTQFTDFTFWVSLIYVRKWRRIRSPKGETTNSTQLNSRILPLLVLSKSDNSKKSLIRDPVIKIPISADHGRDELSKVRSEFDGSSSSSGGGAISEWLILSYAFCAVV
jgi:hypothetical protein